MWCQREGDDLLVNTMREFQRARNLRARPSATVLVVDPGDDTRWIELRCDVTEDGRNAVAQLDALAFRYTRRSPYFGAVVEAELADVEHPVVFRLAPVAVTTGPMCVHGGQRATGAGALVRHACAAEPPIPQSHRDLLGAPTSAALSTRPPSGRARTQPVWCAVDGNDVLVNTTQQRRNCGNLVADPRATLLAIDAKRRQSLDGDPW